jgi:diacylglycerol kinase family enzyme
LKIPRKKEAFHFIFFHQVASGDYSFLRSLIREEEITDVVIAGGDGTVSQVVSSLMKEKVNFGIIPCGSWQWLALAAKISKQPAKALNIIFTGKASSIDGFYVNRQFACMLCGIGFDAKVAMNLPDSQAGIENIRDACEQEFFFDGTLPV